MSEADARRASETDDHAPDIPPAMSESEWADVAKYGVNYLRAESGPRTWWNGDDANEVAAIIALANETLRRFDDPRALLREHVALLRQASRALEDHHVYVYVATDGDCEPEPVSSALDEFADALQSYLPREQK